VKGVASSAKNHGIVTEASIIQPALGDEALIEALSAISADLRL
jgi:hypothetical protein